MNRTYTSTHSDFPTQDIDSLLGSAKRELESPEGFKVALRTLEVAKTKSPTHPLLLKMIADCYETLEDWPAFIAAAEAQLPGLESSEKKARVHFRIGAIYQSKLGQPDLAEESYLRSITTHRNLLALRCLRKLYMDTENSVGVRFTLNLERSLATSTKEREAVERSLQDLSTGSVADKPS